MERPRMLLAWPVATMVFCVVVCQAALAPCAQKSNEERAKEILETAERRMAGHRIRLSEIKTHCRGGDFGGSFHEAMLTTVEVDTPVRYRMRIKVVGTLLPKREFLLVADGKRRWMYSEYLNQYTVQDLKEDESVAADRRPPAFAALLFPTATSPREIEDPMERSWELMRSRPLSLKGSSATVGLWKTHVVDSRIGVADYVEIESSLKHLGIQRFVMSVFIDEEPLVEELEIQLNDGKWFGMLLGFGSSGMNPTFPDSHFNFVPPIGSKRVKEFSE